MLPQDPMILLSFVNTKLRDEYPDLAGFCAAMDADQTDLEATLAGLDYHYSPERNQFV